MASCETTTIEVMISSMLLSSVIEDHAAIKSTMTITITVMITVRYATDRDYSHKKEVDDR